MIEVRFLVEAQMINFQFSILKNMEVIKIIVGPIRTNCYILKSGNELAVVDPGEEAELILEKAKELGGTLKYIINTHYHFDHITANQEIKKVTGAKILIHEKEKPFIDFKVDYFLHDGDEVILGDEKILVRNFPGHSSGSICLFAGENIFTGDLLFKDGYGRTDLAGGSENDMYRSLDDLKKYLKTGITVYPGHGEEFQIALSSKGEN
jgi:hydroxyacylglutathione hydrolase